MPYWLPCREEELTEGYLPQQRVCRIPAVHSPIVFIMHEATSVKNIWHSWAPNVRLKEANEIAKQFVLWITSQSRERHCWCVFQAVLWSRTDLTRTKSRGGRNKTTQASREIAQFLRGHLYFWLSSWGTLQVKVWLWLWIHRVPWPMMCWKKQDPHNWRNECQQHERKEPTWF